MSETLRTFIAVELPPQAREALAQTQVRWRAFAPVTVRWADPQGVHLTLKFLGNITHEQTVNVTAAMERVARGVTPFQLALGAAGAFPNLQRPRVLWMGMIGELETLQALQQRLEEALATLGFPREERPFSPHLTLGRLRDPRKAVPGLSGALPSATWVVDQLILFRSTLLPSGAVYTPLSAVKLTGRPP